MAAALPVALRRNQAVEGAFVVVGGRERVADFPQRQRRTQYLPSKAGQLCVRAARDPRKICERNFDDAEAGGVSLDQDFLLHLEVRGWPTPHGGTAGIRWTCRAPASRESAAARRSAANLSSGGQSRYRRRRRARSGTRPRCQRAFGRATA